MPRKNFKKQRLCRVVLFLKGGEGGGANKVYHERIENGACHKPGDLMGSHDTHSKDAD